MAFLVEISKFKKIFDNRFDKVYEYICEVIDKKSPLYEQVLLLDASCGRVEQTRELDSGVIAIEQSYILGDGGDFESHKKYVDFQLIISGSECMEIGFSDGFEVIKEYDSFKDVMFYKPLAKASKINLYSGYLLVLFPNDIHKGGLKLEDDVVFKTVLKVPLSLFGDYKE